MHLLVNRDQLRWPMLMSTMLVVIAVQPGCTQKDAGVDLHYNDLLIHAPTGWSIRGSVIHNEHGEKIAEFFGDGTITMTSKQFIDEWQSSLSDMYPPSEMVKVESYVVNGVSSTWICTKNYLDNSSRKFDYWYARALLIPLGAKSVIFTSYSRIGCDENFAEISAMAASVTRVEQ